MGEEQYKIITDLGVFSYHSALELLGVAHSAWTRYTLYVEKRRRTLRLNSTDIRFLEHPGLLGTKPFRKLGLRRVEYRGKLLQTTGPERTLIEGFRRLTEVGGFRSSSIQPAVLRSWISNFSRESCSVMISPICGLRSDGFLNASGKPST